jgi:hypothetical protein
MQHHIISYNNKVVAMDYITDKKREFAAGCMRIIDNGANGYVLTPKGQVYVVEQGKRMARQVKDAAQVAQVMGIFLKEKNNALLTA